MVDEIVNEVEDVIWRYCSARHWLADAAMPPEGNCTLKLSSIIPPANESNTPDTRHQIRINIDRCSIAEPYTVRRCVCILGTSSRPESVLQRVQKEASIRN